MHFGVIFPQRSVLSGPDEIRRYVGVVEDLGFEFITIYDHVLGADTSSRENWTGPYSSADSIHEPFVVLGYIAAITRLELLTSVLVLPQRQTALVAKQCAELDWLLNGRFRLGVGIGWNHVEYEALGMNFANRASRMEEQIEVLRLLWTQPIVNFSGRHHRIDRAGILPMPIQRPIPIWMGGGSTEGHTGTLANPTRVLERIGRLGDGWLAASSANVNLEQALSTLRRSAEASGRDPGAIGVQIGINITNPSEMGELTDHIDRWIKLGVSHVGIATTRRGDPLPGQLETLAAVGEVIKAYR